MGLLFLLSLSHAKKKRIRRALTSLKYPLIIRPHFFSFFVATIFETATLTWWNGLRGLMALLGYAGRRSTPGRCNLPVRSIGKGPD